MSLDIGPRLSTVPWRYTVLPEREPAGIAQSIGYWVDRLFVFCGVGDVAGP
ncbi:hypothetical protein ALQ54_200011 [Pseudomonas syringae]|jgi:hypothetical protein|uniref:Uncharacterized protein n=2 Tax=Pseudomonas syringae group TaxID=136849 RepID=A0A3M5TIZ3_9PSED|nr:hypothetical protein ALQ58_200234 [Pseudomonas syringae pv. apii]RMN70998.1 hypothetical protein ALQ54_200011 [Pseudomonas syringae]RMR20385.1 hypothetical protein ALP90_200061 [Pseudomonas amygdali pv. ulmi]RMU33540.1 hypothetical protein ALP32_200192 [Pseudomonas avellanae]